MFSFPLSTRFIERESGELTWNSHPSLASVSFSRILSTGSKWDFKYCCDICQNFARVLLILIFVSPYQFEEII